MKSRSNNNKEITDLYHYRKQGYKDVVLKMSNNCKI